MNTLINHCIRPPFFIYGRNFDQNINFKEKKIKKKNVQVAVVIIVN